MYLHIYIFICIPESCSSGKVLSKYIHRYIHIYVHKIVSFKQLNPVMYTCG